MMNNYLESKKTKKNILNCIVCGKKSKKNNLCSIHLLAFKNLKVSFNIWKEAYHNQITKKEYLNEIAKNSETGDAAKEVIQSILNGELEWKKI